VGVADAVVVVRLVVVRRAPNATALLATNTFASLIIAYPLYPTPSPAGMTNLTSLSALTW